MKEPKEGLRIRVVILAKLDSSGFDAFSIGCVGILAKVGGALKKTELTNLDALQEFEELLLFHG